LPANELRRTKRSLEKDRRALAEDAAFRSRNKEEGVAGGHVDDAETKSWTSQTGRRLL